VIHLAGGYAGGRLSVLERDDAAMATNLVQWGTREGVRQWIFASAAEVYGPCPEPGNLVAELTRRFQSGFCPWFGSGTVPVSFVHVEDVAGTCVRAIEAAPERHSVWNVADDHPTTWRAFLDDFARILGTRRAVGLPDPLPRLYATASSMWARLRGKPPIVTPHIVTLLTTPKVMSNRKLKGELGVRLLHPGCRDGLLQLLDSASETVA
jgi:nucleoside-diphosphate-sugar epimerase